MNIVIDFLHFNKMGYVKVISYDGFEDLHIWSLLGVESTAHLTFRQTFPGLLKGGKSDDFFFS